MRKPVVFLIILIIFILFSLSPVYSINLKLGTLTPAGSFWDDALKALATEWRDITGGEVTIRIYPGGVAGDEGDMLRKMRINQLDAAVLTGMGFTKLNPELFVLSLPFFVQDDDELLYLLAAMKDRLEQLVRDKGFEVVGWQMAGWIYFFSKNPVVYPQDLRTHKISVTADAPEISQIWKNMGFTVVPLSTLDLMSGLQSGMVNSFYSSPILAASYQWFGLAKNMTSLKLSPLVGGLVISERAWKRIPDKYKPALLASAERILAPLYAETIRLEGEAVKVMTSHGLSVHTVPPDAFKQWTDLGERGYGDVIGKTISREIYSEARGHLEHYRRK